MEAENSYIDYTYRENIKKVIRLCRVGGLSVDINIEADYKPVKIYIQKCLFTHFSIL